MSAQVYVLPRKVRDETTIDNCQRVCTAWQANLALSSLAVSVEGGRKRGRERERARQGVGVERGGWYRAASQSTHYAN